MSSWAGRRVLWGGVGGSWEGRRVLTCGCGGPVAVGRDALVDRESLGEPQTKTRQQERAEGLHGGPGRGRQAQGTPPTRRWTREGWDQ